MAIDEQLTNRVRELIEPYSNNIEEKKMFGGICFMVNGKMCVGVREGRIMVRLNPDKQEEALSQNGCTPMDFTGKIMVGFVFVDADAVATRSKLNYWVQLALAYNPLAKASKSKAKKKKN